MTKNERRLVGILALTLFSSAAALSIFSSFLRLRSAEAAEASLEAAIAKAGTREAEPAQLQRRIVELERRVKGYVAVGEGPAVNEEPAVADFGTSMKALIAKRGLAIGRYQVTEAEGGEHLEFAVSGSTLAFLTFIREAETRGARFASLTFRAVPAAENADFVFRIRHGE